MAAANGRIVQRQLWTFSTVALLAALAAGGATAINDVLSQKASGYPVPPERAWQIAPRRATSSPWSALRSPQCQRRCKLSADGLRFCWTSDLFKADWLTIVWPAA